jgi:lipoprotein signal peptidase
MGYFYYKKYISAWSFALLFAGAAGNILDRLYLG